MSEPILEPLWRYWRFWRAKKEMPDCQILFDYGCGPQKPFLNFAKGKYQRAIAVDQLLRNVSFPAKNSVDVVVSLAVIEHLEDPLTVLKKLYQVLKPGGKIIITTPTPLNWAILEILSNLGLQSRREIEEHENYFFRKSLLKLFEKAGFKKIKHNYFEFWLNNLVVAEK